MIFLLHVFIRISNTVIEARRTTISSSSSSSSSNDPFSSSSTLINNNNHQFLPRQIGNLRSTRTLDEVKDSTDVPSRTTTTKFQYLSENAPDPRNPPSPTLSISTSLGDGGDGKSRKRAGRIVPSRYMQALTTISSENVNTPTNDGSTSKQSKLIFHQNSHTKNPTIRTISKPSPQISTESSLHKPSPHQLITGKSAEPSSSEVLNDFHPPIQNVNNVIINNSNQVDLQKQLVIASNQSSKAQITPPTLIEPTSKVVLSNDEQLQSMSHEDIVIAEARYLQIIGSRLKARKEFQILQSKAQDQLLAGQKELERRKKDLQGLEADLEGQKKRSESLMKPDIQFNALKNILERVKLHSFNNHQEQSHELISKLEQCIDVMEQLMIASSIQESYKVQCQQVH